jgi:hypothetical protein
MAIASPPPGASGNGRAEFLIKKTEGTAWLCEARAGEVGREGGKEGRREGGKGVIPP